MTNENNHLMSHQKYIVNQERNRPYACKTTVYMRTDKITENAYDVSSPLPNIYVY